MCAVFWSSEALLESNHFSANLNGRQAKSGRGLLFSSETAWVSLQQLLLNCCLVGTWDSMSRVQSGRRRSLQKRSLQLSRIVARYRWPRFLVFYVSRRQMCSGQPPLLLWEYQVKSSQKVSNNSPWQATPASVKAEQVHWDSARAVQKTLSKAEVSFCLSSFVGTYGKLCCAFLGWHESLATWPESLALSLHLSTPKCPSCSRCSIRLCNLARTIVRKPNIKTLLASGMLSLWNQYSLSIGLRSRRDGQPELASLRSWEQMASDSCSCFSCSSEELETGIAGTTCVT